MIRQMMKKTLLFLCVFMLGATGALAAYPDHPITLVVPFGAGGGTDIPARLLAGMMEKRLGQPIVVQNASGAGGTLGVAQVAAAKPDGYTLGYVPTGTMCLQPHVMKLPYGTDAFDFIGTSVSQPVVLMTAQNAPWKNINEFIEMAKKNPNKYVVGITATGNMTHVPMLQFAEHFGLKLRFIPYRSGGEIFKDIMAGPTFMRMRPRRCPRSMCTGWCSLPTSAARTFPTSPRPRNWAWTPASPTGRASSRRAASPRTCCARSKPPCPKWSTAKRSSRRPSG